MQFLIWKSLGQAAITGVGFGAALRWYMSLDSANIRSFNDLGEAFVKQYKYNVDMAPDRDQLRSMSQKDKETFKEYKSEAKRS